MNELIKELEDKSKSILKSYEARKRKEEYHEQQTHLSGE